MARLFVSIPMQPTQISFSASSSQPLFSPPVKIFSDGVAGGLCLRHRIRDCSVVTRAGPSTSSYLLTFANSCYSCRRHCLHFNQNR
ncbi:hypothetical protein ISN44_As12g025400 [Arabidopsis suecica]|uniref:Uncharacterized protein n=1 Tax=Arabidopsis suecica TaxID=45249 RepID=A0A8T1YMU8_ARASU|nr:hypothetical protein ISN44_As12g025400 [Arabidopsis suecica]